MKRVRGYGQWSLFCPNEAPGLADCWGEEFEELYTKYEREVTLDHQFQNNCYLGIQLKTRLLLLVFCPGQSQKGCSSTELMV